MADTFRTVLTDDFSNGYLTSNWGNPYHTGRYWNDAFTWDKGDVKVVDGQMHVTMSNHGGGHWTAGGFNSFMAGKQITYGVMEFDAQVQEAQGTMAAILTWPGSNKWPVDGEIDILETPKDQAMHTTHWGEGNAGHKYDSIFSDMDPSVWNHFKLTWLPDEMFIEVNGEEVARWDDPAAIPDVPHGFGAMGFVGAPSETWMGGAPDHTTPSKVTIKLDNVKVSQWEGDNGQPEPVPTPPAPEPEPVPPPVPTPNPEPGMDFESELLKLINADRAKAGAAPLVVDRELDAAADAHTADMLTLGYFSHTGKNGSSAGDRMDAAGYDARGWGENIAWVSDRGTAGKVDLAEVQSLHTNLMNSAGHKANLLNSNFKEIGLGLKAEGGKVMLTENFGTPTAAEAAESDKGSAPAPAPQPQPQPEPVPTPEPEVPVPAPSGPDALVLKVSQDAYLGDAKFAVFVDGEQVGGELTASGSRLAGDSKLFTLNGDWGPGEHQVQVKFLNDASAGGDWTKDRNLHVEGATFNGEALEGVAKPLFTTGATATFSFIEDAEPVPEPQPEPEPQPQPEPPAPEPEPEPEVPAPEPEPLPIEARPVNFSGGRGDDTLQVNYAKGMVVNGADGADTIILGSVHSDMTVRMVSGEAHGDVVQGFAEGDLLEFAGYGAGAKVEDLGGGLLNVSDAWHSETIMVEGYTLAEGDFAFV